MIFSENNVPVLSISGYFSGTLNLATSKVLFYPLIGYYIDNNISVEKIKRPSVILLVLCAYMGIVISYFCTFYQGTHNAMKYTQDYVTLFDYLTTICAFVLIKYFCYKNMNFSNYPQFTRVITTIGPLTFGIYLLDPVLKGIMYSQFYEALRPEVMKIIVSILWCFTSMLLGGIITYLLKKVPVLNKIF